MRATCVRENKPVKNVLKGLWKCVTGKKGADLRFEYEESDVGCNPGVCVHDGTILLRSRLDAIQWEYGHTGRYCGVNRPE